MTEIVIASSNDGKIEEIKSACKSLKIKWITYLDVDDWPEVKEDEQTFEGNARKKAVIVAAYFGKPALADDSGLEVDALRGKPGVKSARFSDPDATTEKNNKKLLALLEGLPYEKRTAQFRCVMVLADPDGSLDQTEGTAKGHIVMHPAGKKGFGYDPLFIPNGFDRTMAELSLKEKNDISHRGRALKEIRDMLAGRIR